MFRQLKAFFDAFRAEIPNAQKSTNSFATEEFVENYVISIFNEMNLLALIRSQIGTADEEDRNSLELIYRAMRNSSGLQMPLQRAINSREHASPRFHGANVDVMDNCVVSPDSEIGDYTYIGFNTHITRSKVGRYCSIGNNVSIGPGEHPTDQVSTAAFFMRDIYNELTTRECELGNDVWVGADVIIRRGVKIGDGAVIGANSFVNCDVPNHAIYAGTPAKFLRFRHSEDVRQIIFESRWWDFDLEEARFIIADLNEKCGIT